MDRLSRSQVKKRPPTIKIVSGGQTGADRAALDWAIANDLPHGGWCPRGRLAEDGAIPGFYKLRETVSTEYAIRTERNVWDSDGTVIFTVGRELAGGSKDTAAIATRLKKPWMHLSKSEAIDPPQELRLFIQTHGIKVLNVAGTRASKEPRVGDFVTDTLRKVFADGFKAESAASTKPARKHRT
jgi:Circularly permutated YpsA SLOG family